MIDYEKEIKKMYPLSKVLTVDGLKVVFLQTEEEDHGTAVVKYLDVSERDPWEQAYVTLKEQGGI